MDEIIRWLTGYSQKQLGSHVSFAWRPALGRDGALLGSLTRIFEQTLQGFYAGRARERGQLGAKTGSVSVLQRVSSDLASAPPRGASGE